MTSRKQTIQDFFLGLTKLPYEGGAEKHENQVAAYCDRFGFPNLCPGSGDEENRSALTRKILGLTRDEITSAETFQYKHLEGTAGYIAQPFGSQVAPDFLVVFFGTLYRLELKATKGDNMLGGLNSHIPKANYIYLFSSGKHKRQTVCLGSDWCNDPTRLRLEEGKAQFRKLAAEINKDLAAISGNHGFAMFGRDKVTSSGASPRWSIFGTPKEEEWSGKVLNFAGSLSQ